jgi:hypothetical protein
MVEGLSDTTPVEERITAYQATSETGVLPSHTPSFLFAYAGQ